MKKIYIIIFIFHTILIILILLKDGKFQMLLKGSNIEPKYSAIDNQNNLICFRIFSGYIYTPYSINIIWYKRYIY